MKKYLKFYLIIRILNMINYKISNKLSYYLVFNKSKLNNPKNYSLYKSKHSYYLLLSNLMLIILNFIKFNLNLKLI